MEWMEGDCPRTETLSASTIKMQARVPSLGSGQRPNLENETLSFFVVNSIDFLISILNQYLRLPFARRPQVFRFR